jgi:hypothetical protein
MSDEQVGRNLSSGVAALLGAFGDLFAEAAFSRLISASFSSEGRPPTCSRCSAFSTATWARSDAGAGLCPMPNHFHLALWPRGDSDLSRFMQWLLTAHVRPDHRHYQSSGHVWQGRFKAFPIQQDEHLLTVLRYIERNPLRASLVARADDWWWSSLREQERITLRELTHMPILWKIGPCRKRG